MIFRLPRRTQRDAKPNIQPHTQPDIHPNIQPELTDSPNKLPTKSYWFWLPLLVQTGLILAVPAQDAYTYATGRPVTLQTAPVDPYDPMRGYSQTLRYDISAVDSLKKLPGGSALAKQKTDFYLVLEAPANDSAQPPQPWKPVRVTTRPDRLPANQVALQGKTSQYGNISYGLETYYMPEDQRQQINAQIGSIQRTEQRAFVVEIKVDSAGNAVPISLWVKDQNYRF